MPGDTRMHTGSFTQPVNHVIVWLVQRKLPHLYTACHTALIDGCLTLAMLHTRYEVHVSDCKVT